MRVSWILIPGVLLLREGMGRARRGNKMDVQGLGLKRSEAIGDRGQGLADGF
jgi:hypothetical protein